MYGAPSLPIAAITGRTISAMTRSCMASLMTGAGEYAPMPPVLGPRSPSQTVLWSCAADERQDRGAVRDREEGRLLALEELLHHHGEARDAEGALLEAERERPVRLVQRRGTR